MWDLIVSVPDHCLSFYFASLEGNLTQTRRTIASVTIHSKGSMWDQFVFHIWQNTICLYTLSISIIISGDIPSHFLKILMIWYL